MSRRRSRRGRPIVAEHHDDRARATATTQRVPVREVAERQVDEQRQQRAERDQPVVEAAAAEDVVHRARSTARRTRAASERPQAAASSAALTSASASAFSSRRMCARSTSSNSVEQRLRLVVQRLAGARSSPGTGPRAGGSPAASRRGPARSAGSNGARRLAAPRSAPGTRRRCWSRSPMHSLTLASSAGGSTVASSTTAPIAAGPGFPRAPPSHCDLDDVDGHDRRDEDGAAVVAVEHGRRRRPALRMRSTSVAGIVSWQPWQVLPTSRAAPAPWLLCADPLVGRQQVGRDRRRRPRRGPRAPRRSSASITASFSTSVAARRVGLGLAARAPASRSRRPRVERLLALHQLELAVLERPLVPAQLLDVGLHRLQLARRADRARVHRLLDLFDRGR